MTSHQIQEGHKVKIPTALHDNETEFLIEAMWPRTHEKDHDGEELICISYLKVPKKHEHGPPAKRFKHHRYGLGFKTVTLSAMEDMRDLVENELPHFG